jgi:YHS domain-containing protein
MKTIKALTIILMLTPFFAGTVAWAASQATCPVMGGQINKEFYSDYEGKRVYFCCPACIPEFKKDPAKYIKKLEDQGVELEKTAGSEKKPAAAAPAGQ